MTNRLAVFVAALLAAIVVAIGCMPGLVGGRSAAPADLRHPPMSTFETACMGCHGDYMAFYRKDIGRLSQEKLQATVRTMMLERSKLRASDADVAAMVAYHGALRKKALFLCVLNGREAAAGAVELRGEVTPGTAVEVRKDGAAHTAEVQGFQWTLSAPPAPPFEVVARRGNDVVRLAFPAQQWTHSAQGR